MSVKIAINGFGRIGRNVLRAIEESGRTDIEIVAINDLTPLATNAHLLEHDTVHGNFSGEVSTRGDDKLIVNGKEITVVAERDPAQLPWGELNIDIVFECTGFFTAREAAAKHLEAGAKKVLISAPGKDADLTVVFGVNSDKLEAGYTVVSNASCTTNGLSPVVYALNKEIGVEHGNMITIHAATGDQNNVDGPHSDLYRSRATMQNIIPTSTGAAGAVGLVLPELAGKLTGMSMRVPTLDVSIIELNFVASKSTTVEEVNEIIKKAAEGELKGVLAYNDKKLVSSDFIGNPHSSIFNAEFTKVGGTNNDFVTISTWYDNEMGFSNRMGDTAVAMHKLGYE